MPSEVGPHLALVVARGGSKGLPGKNLSTVGPHSLIAWSVLAAAQAQSVNRTVLSTDCPQMAEEGRRHGAQVPYLRPEALAGDAASPVDVALHLLDHLQETERYQPEWLLLLQPTSPLRTASDLDRALETAQKANAPAVIAVTEPGHHPMLAQTLDPQGRLAPLFPGPAQRRQDLPQVYIPNGAVYWIRAEALRQERTFYPLGTVGYLMPPERSVDIDTAFDLQLANFLWQQQQTVTRSEQAP